MAETLVAGSAYRFELNARKDGALWNLTGLTVKLILKKPDLSESEKTATVTDGPNGVARYASVAADLDVTGEWFRTWEITELAKPYRDRPISFLVEDSP